MTSPSTPVPIADQIAEVGRVHRSIERYPGRMTPETVAAKVHRLRAAEATLTTLQRHADGIRAMIALLRQLPDGMTPADVPRDELVKLRTHPAVEAVLTTFPDAILSQAVPISARAKAQADHDAERAALLARGDGTYHGAPSADDDTSNEGDRE